MILPEQLLCLPNTCSTIPSLSLLGCSCCCCCGTWISDLPSLCPSVCETRAPLWSEMVREILVPHGLNSACMVWQSVKDMVPFSCNELGSQDSVRWDQTKTALFRFLLETLGSLTAPSAAPVRQMLQVWREIYLLREMQDKCHASGGGYSCCCLTTGRAGAVCLVRFLCCSC